MSDTVNTDIPAGPGQQWTIETAMAHCLSVMHANHTYCVKVIEANDHRYEQRFSASSKEVDLAIANRTATVAAAFQAQKEMIIAALANADRAVLKAELANDKRFDGVNEFRAALDNQQRTLIQRSEVDVLFRGLDSKIAAIEKGLEEKITGVTKQQDAQIAERMGLKGGWGYAVGVVGFVLTLATLLVLFLKAAPQQVVVPSATIVPSSVSRP